MSPEAVIQFGGHRLILHADSALYWPGERTLVVSDLHFEKSTFLATHGSFIPPYDTHDTLERLEALLTQYQPQRLILLGDSFHDRLAWERLDAASQQRIADLASRVAECLWVEGNHDRTLSGHGLGQFVDAVEIAGIRFSHDDASPGQPTVIGHYHPKAQVKLRNRTASGRCFLQSRELLILPAFGSYTGGLPSQHEAFAALFQSKPRTHLIYKGKIYSLAE